MSRRFAAWLLVGVNASMSAMAARIAAKSMIAGITGKRASGAAVSGRPRAGEVPAVGRTGGAPVCRRRAGGVPAGGDASAPGGVPRAPAPGEARAALAGCLRRGGSGPSVPAMLMLPA